MQIRPRSWERRRLRRKASKQQRRDAQLERIAAHRTALRGRDDHTGGYGDPPSPRPDEGAPRDWPR